MASTLQTSLNTTARRNVFFLLDQPQIFPGTEEGNRVAGMQAYDAIKWPNTSQPMTTVQEEPAEDQELYALNMERIDLIEAMAGRELTTEETARLDKLQLLVREKIKAKIPRPFSALEEVEAEK